MVNSCFSNVVISANAWGQTPLQPYFDLGPAACELCPHLAN